jgi:hypothetical protein
MSLLCYPFLENEGGWLVIGPQLEDMTQVQGRLLEMPVGLQDLAQLNQLSKTEVIIHKKGFSYTFFSLWKLPLRQILMSFALELFTCYFLR